MADQKDNPIWCRGYRSGQRNKEAYMARAAKAERVLQQIADMDPHGQRADDLGRAARIAREALATAPALCTPPGVPEVPRG
jgi:hypothetical protein